MNKSNPPRGVIAIVVALLTTVLIGFAALAVDLSYVFVVRNELQNAADAAALSGAGKLYGSNSGPNWSDAELQSTSTARMNRASAQLIQDPFVSVGYWNMDGDPKGIQSSATVPTASDLPAVRVEVRKSQTSRDGAVRPFFASIIGKNELDVVAASIAAVSAPSYVGTSALFPFVLSKCMYDTYWNTTSNPPGPRNDPKTGIPYVFVIQPEPNKPGTQPCESTGRGVWTSFFDRNAGASVVSNLITNFNPEPIKIGDQIWIATGLTASQYKETKECSESGSRSCASVTVAVIKDLTQKTFAEVVAFSCLRILDAQQGAKTITVQMTSNCKPPGSGGIGPDYGSRAPPMLVN